MSFKDTLNQIQAALDSLSARQKVTMLFSVLVTVGSVLAIVWWARLPDWAVLKTGLEARDAQAVVAELQTLGIPHRLSHGGTTVEVPQESVYQARMDLGAKGVGTSGRFGYAEMFDSDSVSQSSRMQSIRYKKAQEDELARTIESLESVVWARVHLVLPGDRVFLDDEDQAKASVMVGLAASGGLSSQEVQAVVRTVVGAVEGLHTDNVSVSDASGRVLWAAESGGGFGMGEIEMKTAFEKGINAKIARVLDSVVGVQRYEVQSTVDLEMEKVLRREKNFDPDSAVLISEEKRKEKSESGSTGAIGVPGVAANLPGGAAGAAVGGAGGQTRSESTSNFSYSSVERTVEEPVGRVKRISVAVVVDHQREGGAEGAAEGSEGSERSPQEIAAIEGFVKSAIGFDETRGDVVTVSQRPFVRPARLEPASKFDLMRYLPLVKYPLLIVLLLAVFMLFFRPTLRTVQQALASGPRTASLGGGGGEGFAPLAEGGDVESMRHRLSKLAQEHPEGMARTLRVWLLDDQRNQS